MFSILTAVDLLGEYLPHRSPSMSLSVSSTRPNSIPVQRGPPLFPPEPVTTPHFLPLAPHPGNTAPPPPRRPTLAPLPAGWTRSFHAAPAAYPHDLRECHGTLSRDSHPFGDPAPREGESKAERHARLDHLTRAAVQARLESHEWTLEEGLAAQPKGMFVALERWKRDVPLGGHTIVCTHPNGTQKEHWHPTLRRLLARTRDSSPAIAFGTGAPLDYTPDVLIDDIWLMDHHNHGASVDLNAGAYGPVEIWDDVGRDILNFVVHVLPGAKAQDAPPWQLSWLADGAAPPVRILGFGGSYGGVGHTMAAHSRPDLYAGLFLADSLIAPKLQSAEDFQEPDTAGHVRAALKRRDGWPSRAEAGRTWQQLDFYRAWHPEVFALTLSHGLVRVDAEGKTDSVGDPDIDDAPVVLATPTWAEAAVFMEPVSGARSWDKLPTLHVPVGFVVAKSLFPLRLNQEMVWRPPLARNEHLPDTDHLCLQADPAAIADAAWRFLQTIAVGWGSKEEIRASYDRIVDDKAKL